MFQSFRSNCELKELLVGSIYIFVAMNALLAAPADELVELANRDQPFQHPYLFFASEDVPLLRERIKHPKLAKMWQTVQRRALEPKQGKRQANDMLCAGLAYNITGDRKYAEPAIANVIKLAQSPAPWHDAKYGLKYTDLNAVIKALPIVYAYDILYNAMTPAERETCVDALQEKLFPPYMKALAVYDPERRRFTDTNGHSDWWTNAYFNWNTWINGDVGLAALATLKEIPEAERVLELAQASIAFTYFDYQDGADREDGGHDEGPMYWGTHVSHSVVFHAALERIRGNDNGFFAFPGVRRTMQYGIDFTAPDGTWVNFSDCNNRLVLDPPSGLYFLAARCGRPEFVRHLDDNAAPWYPMPLALLWRPLIEAPRPEPRPRARWYRDVHWALLTTDKAFVPFKAGDLSANHGQWDDNHLLFWYDGERMLNDPGYGKRATADHNTLLVNGKGQVRGKGTRHFGKNSTAFAEILNCGTFGEDSYLVSEAASCYGGALERFQRHLLLVDNGDFLICFDDVVAKNPAAFQVNWHSELDMTALRPNAAKIQGKENGLHLIAVSDSECVTDVSDSTFDHCFGIHSKPTRQTWRLFTVLSPRPEVQVRADFSDRRADIYVSGRAFTFTSRAGQGYRYSGGPVTEAERVVE